ncbi:bifunctional DNA primase/polymerase [Leifsonia kafniensis]|uniref:Bifunctional DNA primase/polymerase n=1 Tax=Leifsonia kafniensis TaxID=475957 RepID=A0ABP7KC83_9MICO
MDAAVLLASVSGLPLPAAARRFVTDGVAVFPCVPGGKRPLTSHGFHDASVDPARVESWWSRWPDANIGLPTGVSGMDVVDIDVHTHVSGFVAFERARRRGLVDGWVALVRTPSGGVHAYFPANASHPQSSWQAATVGIDFRGAGGYVVAPPSSITADDERAVYELIARGKSSPRPVDARALREFLNPRPTVSMMPTDGVRADANVARLVGWVASRGEGERNRGLFWAACRLAESGIRVDVACSTLGPAAEHVGLPGAEIVSTIRSAYRATDGGRATHRHDEVPRREPRRAIAQVLP